jgi:hypothetical protein
MVPLTFSPLVKVLIPLTVLLTANRTLKTQLWIVSPHSAIPFKQDLL